MEQQTEEDIQKKRETLKLLLDFGALEINNEDIISKKIIDMTLREKKQTSMKEIKYIDNPCSFGVIKNAVKENWIENKSMVFLVNKNKSIKGKITNKIEEGSVEIPLIEHYRKEHHTKFGPQVEQGLMVFGEKRIADAKVLESLSCRFNVYRMLIKENENIQTYTVLSEKRLDIGEYEIEGMELTLEDFAEISKYTKFMKKTNLIFVNEARPSKIVFKSKQDFMDTISGLNLNEDSFFENLLSVGVDNKFLYFQHPRVFERLVGAFFTSCKYDSTPYPLHLLVIGKQGGGKSKAMEAVSEKLDETIPIVEGSGSTMKSLIPSFKGELTKPGALIESNRIVCIDEFFRILMRVDKDDRENTLTHLNPLLEHKKRRFGSGNNFLDAQMTSKMLAVTNPVFGTSSMDSLIKKMDNSFLSRLLIWYQDEEHYNMILSKKESDLKNIDHKISIELWKAIFDFCNSFKVEIDNDEFSKIHAEGLGNFGPLPEELREMYKTRYKHHLMCLIDGIVKLRCIFEKDINFTAKESDYQQVREIWNRMIQNWRNGLENVRFQLREERYY